MRLGICAQCGGEFTARTKQKRFCSLRCSEVMSGRRLAAPHPPRVCALDGCGVEFVPMMSTQKCCCEHHGKIHWNRVSRAEGRQRQVWNDKRRDHWHRRRAQKKAVTTGEPVVLQRIADRDGWRCHLCGGRVLTKPWPNPKSASLDHVVPISAGGAHDPANVRLAHLSCNVAKGNRGGGEQLMLIG